VTIEQHLNVWLNVATLLVIAGAATYCSLWRHMD
jgi:hypothetical protein